MTAHFTADNTEGFSTAELEILNDALDLMMGDTTGMSDDDLWQWRGSYGDAINNAWVGQTEAAQLAADARKLMLRN